jgi:two-component system response regulator FixJ
MHVHVIDDDEAIRVMLRAAMKAESLPARFYESAAEFLKTFNPAEPGCIVLDLRMPDMDGLELLRRLHKDGVRTPIIVISGHADVPEAVASMKMGATDVLQKPFKIAELVQMIRAALAVSVAHAEQEARDEQIRQRFAALTRRELELVKYVVGGSSSKQIASGLHISIRTVANHRANLMAKVKAVNTADLARLATIAGIVPAQKLP